MLDFTNPKSFQDTKTSAISMNEGLRRYMLSIFNYMALALVVTGIAAYVAANSSAFQSLLYVQSAQGTTLSGIGWLISLAPLGIAMFMGFKIHDIKLETAQALFWSYSALMGLSLSILFLYYTGESIFRTFLVTASTFGAMSIYGYTTKKDLTGMGSFLIMGLLGLLLASLVNMFLKSSGLDFATSVIGVLIFTGLTAYDVQKLKNVYHYYGNNSTVSLDKIAVIGALNLYMDFINLFLYLLRFMGNRRED